MTITKKLNASFDLWIKVNSINKFRWKKEVSKCSLKYGSKNIDLKI